jgi:DNA invertase Pin-like site-specific DNA recombinase
MSTDREPDIIEIIMQMAQAVGLDAAAAVQIEQRVRAEYGGLRVRIPKKKKHLSPEQREQLFRDGLSNMSTNEITEKYRIDRATLYRHMKRER